MAKHEGNQASDPHAALFPDDIEVTGGFDYSKPDPTIVDQKRRDWRPSYEPGWVRADDVGDRERTGWVRDPEQPKDGPYGSVLMWKHRAQLTAERNARIKRNLELQSSHIEEARTKFGGNAVSVNPDDLRGQ